MNHANSQSIIHAAKTVCDQLGVKPANVGCMDGRSAHPRHGTWSRVRALVFTELWLMGFNQQQIAFYFGVTQYQVANALRIGRALLDGAQTTDSAGSAKGDGDEQGAARR